MNKNKKIQDTIDELYEETINKDITAEKRDELLEKVQILESLKDN